MKNILGPDSCASVPGSGLSRRLLVLEACWGVDLSCKSSVAVPVSQEGQVCCSEAAESSGLVSVCLGLILERGRLRVGQRAGQDTGVSLGCLTLHLARRLTGRPAGRVGVQSSEPHTHHPGSFRSAGHVG